MATRAPAVRFAFGSPSSARSAVWRVWADLEKGDVYLASRTIAGHLKVSLHQSGIYRFAFTQEYARKPANIIPPGRDRLIHKWNRPADFVPGYTKAFAVLVPWLALAEYPKAPERGGSIMWLAAPQEGIETQVHVILESTKHHSDERWPGRTSMGTACLGWFDLPKERAWLVSNNVQLSHEQQEKLKALQKGIRVVRKSEESRRMNLRALFTGGDPDGCWWFRDLPILNHGDIPKADGE